LQLFALLLRLLHLNSTLDWNSITTVWVQSGDWQSCAEALTKLVNEQNLLDAYQIGFDLSEVATQGFVESVRRTLAQAGLGPEEGAVSALLDLGEPVSPGANLGRKRANHERCWMIFCEGRRAPSSF
jgi:26S proteasome regulatory subunit N2